jgi:hypothetical protein
VTDDAKATAGAKAPASKAAPVAAKKGASAAIEEKSQAELDQERILRNSIDHESKIRDQIAALTGKVSDFPVSLLLFSSVSSVMAWSTSIRFNMMHRITVNFVIS